MLSYLLEPSEVLVGAPTATPTVVWAPEVPPGPQQLMVRKCIWRMETSGTLQGLQVQVTVMASYGIIFLGKKLRHNCLSRLRSINEYLVFD